MSVTDSIHFSVYFADKRSTSGKEEGVSAGTIDNLHLSNQSNLPIQVYPPPPREPLLGEDPMFPFYSRASASFWGSYFMALFRASSASIP